jgi:hypothetical protein
MLRPNVAGSAAKALADRDMAHLPRATVLLPLLIAAAPALASEACRDCLVRDRTPDLYGVPRRPVVLRPEGVRHVHVPARERVVRERVVVAPEQVVERHVPAYVGVVQERVVVAPATRRQVWTVDATGREVLCEEDVPAQTALQSRHVHVPARVERVVIPAQTEVVARRVVTPGRVVPVLVPGEVHQRPEIVAQAPATHRWRPETPWATRRGY